MKNVRILKKYLSKTLKQFLIAVVEITISLAFTRIIIKFTVIS